jgi:hypothetical protein
MVTVVVTAVPAMTAAVVIILVVIATMAAVPAMMAGVEIFGLAMDRAGNRLAASKSKSGVAFAVDWLAGAIARQGTGRDLPLDGTRLCRDGSAGEQGYDKSGNGTCVHLQNSLVDPLDGLTLARSP